MDGRRHMADGKFDQGQGSKEEAGAVDPSRDERGRGSRRYCGEQGPKSPSRRSRPPARQAPTSASRPRPGRLRPATLRRRQHRPLRHPLRRRLPQQQSQEDKPPEDKDRPTLKRGKAGAVSAEEAQKKMTASASAKDSEPSSAVTPTSARDCRVVRDSPVTQGANQIQLIPAISDSHGPDLASLHLQHESGGRTTVPQEDAGHGRGRSPSPRRATGDQAPPQPAHAPSPHGKATAVKPLQPIFEDVQLRIFDLADINEPELVLTAKAHMPQRSR